MLGRGCVCLDLMRDWLWLWCFFLLFNFDATLDSHIFVNDRRLDKAVGLDSYLLRLDQPCRAVRIDFANHRFLIEFRVLVCRMGLQDGQTCKLDRILVLQR